MGYFGKMVDGEAKGAAKGATVESVGDKGPAVDVELPGIGKVGICAWHHRTGVSKKGKQLTKAQRVKVQMGYGAPLALDTFLVIASGSAVGAFAASAVRAGFLDLATCNRLVNDHDRATAARISQLRADADAIIAAREAGTAAGSHTPAERQAARGKANGGTPTSTYTHVAGDDLATL